MNTGLCAVITIISVLLIYLWQILVMSHKRIHKQQAFKVAEEEQKQQQHEEAATDILMATQNQEQAGEATGLQFVDSMGFVNILVLTDQTEIQ